MREIRNKRIATLIVAAALALGIGFGSASPAISVGSPTVQVACKQAIIGGQRKCIQAGQFCARRYERDYNRYGFTCSKRDANGRYHLKKR